MPETETAIKKNIRFSIPNEALNYIENTGTYTFSVHTGNDVYQVKLIRADKDEPINVRLRLLPCGNRG